MIKDPGPGRREEIIIIAISTVSAANLMFSATTERRSKWRPATRANKAQWTGSGLENDFGSSPSGARPDSPEAEKHKKSERSYLMSEVKRQRDEKASAWSGEMFVVFAEINGSFNGLGDKSAGGPSKAF